MKKDYELPLMQIRHLCDDVITSSRIDPCSVDIFDDNDFVTGGES